MGSVSCCGGEVASNKLRNFLKTIAALAWLTLLTAATGLTSAKPAFAFFDSLECTIETNVGLEYPAGSPAEMYVGPVLIYSWQKAVEELSARPDEQLLLLKRIAAMVPGMPYVEETGRTSTQLVAEYSKAIKETDTINFAENVLTRGSDIKMFASQYTPCSMFVTNDYESSPFTCVSDRTLVAIDLTTLEISMADFDALVSYNGERNLWIGYGKCGSKR